jgi:hypothetical protein
MAWNLYPTAENRPYKADTREQKLAARNLARCHVADGCEDFAEVGLWH